MRRSRDRRRVARSGGPANRDHRSRQHGQRARASRPPTSGGALPGGFEVLGREPGAEARGCSVAADELLSEAGATTPARDPRPAGRAARGAALSCARRPAREVHAALARVLDLFGEPGSKWRRRLEDELPGATGFTPENVREGLARGLARFRGEALLSLVRAELGARDASTRRRARLVSGFETTAVLLAGSIPQPTLLALLAPLALRSPVLAQARLARSRHRAAAGRSDRGGGSRARRCTRDRALRLATTRPPERAAGGGLRRRDGLGREHRGARRAPRAAQRFVAPGPPRSRWRRSARGARAARRSARQRKRVALDVALWDQQGCLSPLAVYAVGADARAGPARGRARGRARVSRAPRFRAARRTLPKRRGLPARVRRRRAARGGEPAVRLLGGRAALGASCARPTRRRAGAPLHRFVRVHPVADIAGRCLPRSVRYAAHLAAVALAGFGAARDAARARPRRSRRLAPVPPGALQSPPLAWHHDGRPVLLPLARFTDREDPLDPGG